MKTKFVLLAMIVLSFCALHTIDGKAAEKATTDGLVIEQLSGSDMQYALELIGSIRFENEEMFLYNNKGEVLGNTPINNIGKIVFATTTEGTTSIDNARSSTNIRIYPNPTQDILIIDGLPQGQTIRVYNMQGQILTSVLIDGLNAKINLANLQQGTYLLQIGAEIVKIIKH